MFHIIFNQYNEVISTDQTLEMFCPKQPTQSQPARDARNEIHFRLSDQCSRNEAKRADDMSR